MSLDKAILHGKEKRKAYRGSKAVCKSCRNHGSCPYCNNSRKFKEARRAPYEATFEEDEYSHMNWDAWMEEYVQDCEEEYWCQFYDDQFDDDDWYESDQCYEEDYDYLEDNDQYDHPHWEQHEEDRIA